jgi:hypothetical protein
MDHGAADRVMILLMRAVKRHYVRVDRRPPSTGPSSRRGHRAHRGVPIDRWSRITEKALSFALSMSCDIRCLHVQTADEPDEICQDWEKDVAAPLRAAGKCVPNSRFCNRPSATSWRRWSITS